MKRALLAFACVAVAVGVSAGASAAPTGSKPSAKKPNGNPWGVTIVRFTKGTTLAEMQAAVRAAGGGG